LVEEHQIALRINAQMSNVDSEKINTDYSKGIHNDIILYIICFMGISYVSGI